MKTQRKTDRTEYGKKDRNKERKTERKKYRQKEHKNKRKNNRQTERPKEQQVGQSDGTENIKTRRNKDETQIERAMDRQ